MFHKEFYKNLSEDEIFNEIEKDGFNPIKIHDKPNYLYPPHTHPEMKLLVFLNGQMTLKVGSELYACEAYDKVIVPGNILHEATVGPVGCKFFWSEKLILDNTDK